MNRRGLILDTNLLLLLVTGNASRDYIRIHKRLTCFNDRDFVRLSTLVSGFDRLVFTPHVLAETSNFVRQVSDPARSRIHDSLCELVGLFEEEFTECKVVCGSPASAALGITDSVLMTLVSRGHALLTVDAGLYHRACAISENAYNFNHERESL